MGTMVSPLIDDIISSLSSLEPFSCYMLLTKILYNTIGSIVLTGRRISFQ